MNSSSFVDELFGSRLIGRATNPHAGHVHTSCMSISNGPIVLRPLRITAAISRTYSVQGATIPRLEFLRSLHASGVALP